MTVTDNAASTLDAVSREFFCQNKSWVTGFASTQSPTAQGMAMSMVTLTAFFTFRRVSFFSPLAKLAATVGITAEHMAEAMAMGILLITTAFPE